MLKERVLTGIVLVAVLLGVTLGLPPVATVWLLTTLVIVGAWEWASFLGKPGPALRAAYTAFIGLLLLGGYQWMSTPGVLFWVTAVAVVWWFVAFLWICVAPGRVNGLSAALAGVLALVPCWMALVHVTQVTQGTTWVLFTLVLVWAADTGAFFTGRWLGRVPLAPRVSPKKTWEGVIGGVLTSGLVAWIAATWLLSVNVWPFVATCLAVAALSVVGDLTESMLKRAAGLKDSGHLFPGHGGMLDRIDSVTAAAPALVFALLGLQVIP